MEDRFRTEGFSVTNGLEGLVAIDEVQRRPDLFSVLRVLVDRVPAPARFLILGSASGDLLRQTSESLAGRMELVLIGGFRLRELGAEAEARLRRRGAFPLSYLAEREYDSLAWRRSFIRTLLERDFPQWGGAGARGRSASLLDDAGALSRPDPERAGAGTGARRQRVVHDAALFGSLWRIWAWSGWQ